MPSKESYSPADLGHRWGKKPESIIGLIRSRQLRGINVASKLSGRPRWRILAADVERFEAQRSVASEPPSPRPRRKRPATLIEFF